MNSSIKNPLYMFVLFAVLVARVSAQVEDDHDEHEDEHNSTTDAYLFTIIGTILVSVCSLAGIVFLTSNKTRIDFWMMPLIGLSIGTLLGNSFFQLLPEVNNEMEHGVDLTVSLVILAGIVFGYLTEVILHHHHPNEEIDHAAEKELPHAQIQLEDVELQASSQDAIDCENCDPESGNSPNASGRHSRHHIAVTSLLGDFVHNFVDGLLIGATFLTSTSTGITTCIAIALHEIPQEVGDFCVLLHSGMSKTRALVMNFIIALASVLGGVLAVALGTSGSEDAESFALHVVPFAVGMFLYLALAALGPEISKIRDRKQKLIALGCILLGIVIMGLLLLLPFEGHDHGHGDEEHHHDEEPTP